MVCCAARAVVAGGQELCQAAQRGGAGDGGGASKRLLRMCCWQDRDVRLAQQQLRVFRLRLQLLCQTSGRTSCCAVHRLPCPSVPHLHALTPFPPGVCGGGRQGVSHAAAGRHPGRGLPALPPASSCACWTVRAAPAAMNAVHIASALCTLPQAERWGRSAPRPARTSLLPAFKPARRIPLRLPCLHRHGG